MNANLDIRVHFMKRGLLKISYIVSDVTFFVVAQKITYRLIIRYLEDQISVQSPSSLPLKMYPYLISHLNLA